MDKGRICIVTPNYINSTPRVIKEADALHEAGFNVRVVFSQGNLENIRKFDGLRLKGKKWRWDAVGWSPFRKKEKPLYYKSKLRLHIAKNLPAFFWRFGKFAEHAEGRIYKELAGLVAREKADIYIGHYPTGLAAASFAAFRWKAKLAYDIEDIYTEEHPPNPKRQMKRIEVIERRYLPHCSHITVASELFVDEMVRRYNISPPRAIHNVFPWSERKSIDGKTKDRRSKKTSLYWFSQTVGRYRGIEDVIKAMGLIKDKVELHLRGSVSGSIKKRLISLASKYRVDKDIYFHPFVPPEELLSRAAEHDIGLALEEPLSLNRKLCISNKLLFYLLGGLALAVSDTPGQRYVMSTCPETGFLYRPGDYKALADNINTLLSNPDKLKSCKEAALEAARNRWSWEKESVKLINSFREKLIK